jgi:hypothetical protein
LKLSIFKKALISGIMTAAIVAGSLIAAMPAAAAGSGSMYIDPATQSVGNGAPTITVNVKITSTTATRGAQAVVNFDHTKLQVVGTPTYPSGAGAFFTDASHGTLFPITPVVDNVAGTVSNLGMTLLGGTGGFTGTGTFVTIVFSAVSPASNNSVQSITITGAGLADVNASPETMTVTNGAVTIGTIAQPDLVVSAISVAPEADPTWYDVTYTITNQGTAAAVASTTAIEIDGAGVISELPCPALAAGASNTVTTPPGTLAQISGTSDTITVMADELNNVIESNETNNTATITYSYYPPGANPVPVNGSVAATFTFTPPSAINFNTLAIGPNVVTGTLNVTSNQNWQITAQGLAPTTAGGTDGKMTKWSPLPAPAGTYSAAVKLGTPLNVYGTSLNGTVQTIMTGGPASQASNGTGQTISVPFSQTLLYTDGYLATGYNYHIIVNFICTPSGE